MGCRVFLILHSTLLLGTNLAICDDQVAAPSAEWVWQNNVRQDKRPVYFRKTFHLKEPVRNAELTVGADFNRAAVYINGVKVGSVADYGPVITFDVTELLSQGDNLFAVEAKPSTGPAALAVTLQVRFRSGAKSSYNSDKTWLSSAIAKRGWHQRSFDARHWKPVATFGQVAPELWVSDSEFNVSQFEDYTQWKRALTTGTGTDPATFDIRKDFEIEILRSARKNEGSWVSMAFDPKGRLTIAREDKGLLRVTLPSDKSNDIKVETINDSLLECRGLLYAFNSLYANANNSKGLYRLRDTNGDDQFDDVKLLHHSPGGVGHGRNDLALGPDGMIYSIHGDSVDLPKDFLDHTSPYRKARQGAKSREGHVIRIDPDGKKKELIAAGLRNPFGIHFNADGEPFTYDADAEFDMGSSWYRPTRVNHIVTGGDFGWRGVTGTWPPYYPDRPENAVPNLDIGRGSPTAVQFGTRSNFPDRYRRALFILDWSYGRIVAVHMRPRGASYVCQAETFLQGRPLNVTDLTFGPDGSMYFVTGGRKTQSALYRVRYRGATQASKPTQQQTSRRLFSKKARYWRRQLENAYASAEKDGVDTAWALLRSPDPWTRHAARVTLEHQSFSSWQALVFSEAHPTGSVTALLALARAGETKLDSRILSRLSSLPLQRFTPEDQLIALRVYSICIGRTKNLDTTQSQKLSKELMQLVKVSHSDHQINPTPSTIDLIRREVTSLLVQLKSSECVPVTLALFADARSEQQRMHYVFVLRNQRSGWTLEQRREYLQSFQELAKIEAGAGMPDFLNRIRSEITTSLTKEEQKEFHSWINAQRPSSNEPLAIDRPFVREWVIGDLETSLAKISEDQDLERGRKLFRACLCSRCHRLGGEGFHVGPELTSAARRFSRRDILRSILDPSDVVAENYRNVRVVTVQGQVVVGRVVPNSDFRSPTLRIATNPLEPSKYIDIPKKDVEVHESIKTSSMPKGLLNSLSKSEILDLLAFIENAKAKRRE